MTNPQEHLSTDLAAWTRSDRYHNDRLIGPPDPVLLHALNADVPKASVSEAQGKFLQLVARSINAVRILEVGTLAGYSTIWLGRALPDNGRLVSLELDENHAQTARESIRLAGLESKVAVVLGPAIHSLTAMQPDPPFDFVFIDADKQSNLDYFIEAKRLIRPGGVIIVDNVVRNGLVSDPEVTNPPVEGVRRLLEYLKDDRTVDATTISTVGEKGYDGFIYAIRL
ncbi:O-methyltransferase family 3 protein [Hysterangium stoloniferum]|nr:O-methyltransferase family 3 protein [Hysterangium stoloniferum]